MTETAAVTGQRFRRKPEISLEDQRGTIRCGRCGREWDHNNNGNLAEAHKQFKEHLPECLPGFQPRSIEEIRKEINGERKAAKEEKEKKEGEIQLAARKAAQKVEPRVLEPRRASQLRREPRSRRQQPFLTEEMIEEARRLYEETGSIRKVAERCYSEWGYPSEHALRDVLYKAYQGRGMKPNIRRNQRVITGEMVEKAKCLYQEGESVWGIARRYHLAWGYSSANSLRKVLYEIFGECGIKPRGGSKRTIKRSRMTPERTEVAWNLYSIGGYSLREIGEMSHELWRYAPSSCKNNIGEALKRAGYKLRAANRWENDGSRPISKREAMKMIKSVA